MAEFRSEPEAPSYPPPPPPRRTPRWLWGALAGAMLLLCLSLGALLYVGTLWLRGDSERAAQSTPIVVTPPSGAEGDPSPQPTPPAAPTSGTAEGQPPSAPATPRPTATAPAITLRSIFELTVGDCFQDPATLDEANPVETVEQVPCDEPHDNELYAIVPVEGEAEAPYPGEAALDALAAPQCLSAFEGYVALPFEQSRLSIGSLQPSADSWATGDRTIACVLYDGQLLPLEESMFESGQ